MTGLKHVYRCDVLASLLCSLVEMRVMRRSLVSLEQLTY